MAKLFKTTDLLLVVSAVTVAILAGLLVLAAAHDPQIRLALPIFFVGMVGGGLLLFRQWRKAHGSLIASKARARYRATHDDLTQLPNRVLLLERIGEVLGERRDGASAVLCIALGRLREIEDSFGDAVADQVTLQVAERLRDACRDADTIARLASDEFAILWRGVEPQRVETLAQALRDLTSGGVDTTRGRLLLVTTVGVSLGDAAEGSATEVLRRARLAMAFAKRTDTQVRLFSPEMDHDLRDRTAMEAELHEAVAAGQIRMVYQPQSNGRGVMTGAEALMRWTSPSRGEVPPSVFIPLAEACGLSEQLGAFALRQSFTDAKRWPGLKIAINVSTLEIRSGRLFELLKTLLQETGATPSQFELEITEGVLLHDTVEVCKTLAAIRRLGFKIALDDFGTGYSSLSYLRGLPIDKIKIDRSFITHLGLRPECESIVKAIMNLALALDLKVIAEGVETQTQMDRLADVGCHQIQGYLYSRPIEAADLDQFMLTTRKKLLAA
jgi:diguanylate cyclase (GGDEF)-like protein